MSEVNSKISKTSILKSTLVAAVVATLLLVMVVLPAEYGIDPTHVGELLGITGISSHHHSESVEKSHQATEQSPKSGYHSHYQQPADFVEIEVVLAAESQAEYKFVMQAESKLTYHWQTDGGMVYADLHGHTVVAADSGEQELVERYLDTQEGTQESGDFKAPFTGEHGWYFLNLEDRPVTITLKVAGQFQSHLLLELGQQGY